MILMLFHLFCMFDDYWRIDHRSLESAGKSTVKIQYLRRSENKSNQAEVTILPDHGGGQRGSPRWGPGGPHHAVARLPLLPRRQVVRRPWPTSGATPARTSSLQKPKVGGFEQKQSRRLHEAENTRERKALRQGEICRGNSFPERGDHRHPDRHHAGLHRNHHLHRHHHHHRCTISFRCNI